MSHTALREFSLSACARVEEKTGKEGEENRGLSSTVQWMLIYKYSYFI